MIRQSRSFFLQYVVGILQRYQRPFLSLAIYHFTFSRAISLYFRGTKMKQSKLRETVLLYKRNKSNKREYIGVRDTLRDLTGFRFQEDRFAKRGGVEIVFARRLYVFGAHIFPFPRVTPPSVAKSLRDFASTKGLWTVEASIFREQPFPAGLLYARSFAPPRARCANIVHRSSLIYQITLFRRISSSRARNIVAGTLVSDFAQMDGRARVTQKTTAAVKLEP